MKLLVVTQEPATAALLREVSGDLPADAEVQVISPATTHSALRFWVSDVDEAIAHADEVQAQTVAELAGDGIDVTGDVGDAEPLVAIEDALRTFAADRIVLIEHGKDHRDYQEDDDLAAQVRGKFGLPVAAGAAH